MNGSVVNGPVVSRILVQHLTLAAILLAPISALAGGQPLKSASVAAGARSAQTSKANRRTSSATAPATTAANVLPSQPNVYMLPHIVTGVGYVTKITVVNTSTTAASGQINFIGRDGSLLSTTAFSLAPGATFRFQTNESDRFGPYVINWAAVGSDQPVGINLFFEYIPQGGGPHGVANSAGFSPSALLTDFTILVEVEPTPADASIGRTVGVALANPNSSPANVTVSLVDFYGEVDASTTLSVPAFGQITFDPQTMATIGSAYPDSDYLGSLIISSSVPLAALAVQDTYGPFASTPILPGRGL